MSVNKKDVENMKNVLKINTFYCFISYGLTTEKKQLKTAWGINNYIKRMLEKHGNIHVKIVYFLDNMLFVLYEK